MRFTLRVEGVAYEVVLVRDRDRVRAIVDGMEYPTEVTRGHEGSTVTIGGPQGGRPINVRVKDSEVWVDGTILRVELDGLELGGSTAHHAAGAQGRVKPPMPGKVIAVRVKPGDTVKAGETLLVLEAMKMQNEISAPVAGTVKEVKAKPGQAVESKDVLVIIE
ncbi:MAG: biotin/lipoyl-containing protein [Thermoplasmatota archaeon]